ncbi:MAG: type II toxin-antitoxin system ParD family antitoxin [Alphaproteobacteria bacterium]|nr:type II toxin-antitoxin system ParD family antitoxin [Alphaproteobacteria bacterium]
MATVEKISIALTPDMAAAVRKAVEGGGYASSSEVVREALRDWQMKQFFRQQQIEEIRRLWQEGINSGQGRFGSIDDLLAEAHRRFDAKNAEQE